MNNWLDEFRDAHAPVTDVVARGLIRAEQLFSREIESDLECVRDLCARVERYRGKMLRPTLTILSGLAAAGRSGAETSDEQIRLAAVVEMIHVATLVHDDVLDEAAVRRQRPTISKLRGNEAAVILGDYMISSAFHLCSTIEDQRVALRIGEITTSVCEGELLQLHHRQDHDLDEATYFEIIRRKTASLIGVACELGAQFSNAPEAVQRRLRDFGMRIGVAFQIQDDLLDLMGEERIVGKSVGKDLEKGKLTLPLIHHLAVAQPDRREESIELLIGLWRGERGGTLSGATDGATAVAELTDVRQEIRRALLSTSSIEYAGDAASAAVRDSLRSLEGVPESPSLALLRAIAGAVLSRER